PPSTPISSSAGGVTAFDGVSALTQVNAGTGIYANTNPAQVDLPSQALCAGDGFVIEGDNLAFGIHDDRGALLSAVTNYNQFFNVPPETLPPAPPAVKGTFLSSPLCDFDPIGHRFIQAMTEVDAPGLPGGPGTRTHLMIAITATDDPTGSWNVFS